MKTVVLVHGCHLQALLLNGKGWEDIMFGHTPCISLEGRVVMGLHQAIEYNASRIIFSTGASSREGVVEALYTRIATLERLPSIEWTLGLDAFEKEKLRILVEGAHIDDVSKNTREEVTFSIEWCATQGIDRLILVSSPWHIARCHAEALEVLHTRRVRCQPIPEIIAIGSHGSTQGVVISEPPHRGDRPSLPINQYVKRVDRLGRSADAQQFAEALEVFLQQWEQ